MRKRSGFTLLETAAVVGVVSLLVGVLAPAVKMTRSQARGVGSAANLMFIGQGSGMYAQDHAGRIFSYTWEGPRNGQSVVFFDMPDGFSRSAVNDQEAAAWQQTAILMNATGRTTGPDRFRGALERVPHKRTILLVLQDYLNRPFPDPMVADPSDTNLLQWQANPLDISIANNIPYAPGADTSQYDSPGLWVTTGVRQRWAFTSSYQTTTSAWQSDSIGGEPAYVPVSNTPHLFQGGNGIPLADGRNFNEVVFPSQKVYFFEEFDREQAGSPYFAYDHARPEKLMFDGSVNSLPSGEARPSWNPANGKQEWRQTYVPLHTFPLPMGGFGDLTLLSQRYRWTLGGLKGIDYVPGPLMAP